MQLTPDRTGQTPCNDESTRPCACHGRVHVVGCDFVVTLLRLRTQRHDEPEVDEQNGHYQGNAKIVTPRLLHRKEKIRRQHKGQQNETNNVEPCGDGVVCIECCRVYQNISLKNKSTRKGGIYCRDKSSKQLDKADSTRDCQVTGLVSSRTGRRDLYLSVKKTGRESESSHLHPPSSGNNEAS